MKVEILKQFVWKGKVFKIGECYISSTLDDFGDNKEYFRAVDEVKSLDSPQKDKMQRRNFIKDWH